MELDIYQTDALNELGNIGAAHAATTLSQMLMSPVEMTVPEVLVVDIADVYQYIGDEISALVVFQIQGDLADGGYIVVSMPIGAVTESDEYDARDDGERPGTHRDGSECRHRDRKHHDIGLP